MNPKSPEQTIFIHHKDNRFSRCILRDIPRSARQVQNLTTPCPPTTPTMIPSHEKIYRNLNLQSISHRYSLFNWEISRFTKADDTFQDTLTDIPYQLGISTLIAFLSGNPALVGAQGIKSVVNLTTTYCDPHKENPLTKGVQLTASYALQFYQGVPKTFLLASGAVDLAKHCFEDEDEPSEFNRWTEDTALSTIKACLCLDEERFLSGVMSGTISAALRKTNNTIQRILPCTTSDPMRRTLKALCNSEDLHNIAAQHLTKKYLKYLQDKEKSKVTESQEPSNTPTGPSGLPPPTPEHFDIIYRVTKSDGSYLVIRERDGFPPHTAGKFPSEKEAKNWAQTSRDEIRQINAHNQALYQKQLEAWNLGVSLDVHDLHYLEPLYLTIDAPGYKARLNIGGEKDARIENKNDPDKARQQILQIAKNYINNHLNSCKNQISLIQTAIDTQAPPHITPPQGLHEVPAVEYGNETIHLLNMNNLGETTLVGRFKSDEEAQLAAGAKAFLEVNIFDYETQCFQACEQAVSNGVSIDDLPSMPTFERPNVKGNTYDDISGQYGAANIRNRATCNHFISQVSALSSEPIQVTPMSPTDKVSFTSNITPDIQPTQHAWNSDHGFWYNFVRCPKEGADRVLSYFENGAQWAYTTPLYPAPKPVTTHAERQLDLLGQQATLLPSSSPNAYPVANNTPRSQVQSFHPDQNSLLLDIQPTFHNTSPNFSCRWKTHMTFEQFKIMQLVESTIEVRRQAPSFPSLQTASLLPSNELVLAGYHPSLESDFLKNLPKVIGRIGIEALKFLVPDMSDFPNVENPHEHLDRVSQNLGIRYNQLFHIQTPNSLTLKADTLTKDLFLGLLGKVASNHSIDERFFEQIFKDIRYLYYYSFRTTLEGCVTRNPRQMIGVVNTYKAVRNLIAGNRVPLDIPHSKVYTIEGNTLSSVDFLFINGAFTNQNTAMDMGRNISSLLGDNQVHVIHNSTHGYLDILDCAFEKTHNMTNITNLAYKQIMKSIDAGRTPILFLHSEGAIIYCSLAQRMTEEQLSKVQVYAFGPGAIIPEKYGSKVRNFISEGDSVAKFSSPIDISRAKSENWTHVQFLAPNSNSILTEHSFMGDTYQNQLADQIEDIIEELEKNK